MAEKSVLTEEEIAILIEARKARLTPEFIESFRADVEESRRHCERLRQRYEPTPERMSERYGIFA